MISPFESKRIFFAYSRAALIWFALFMIGDYFLGEPEGLSPHWWLWVPVALVIPFITMNFVAPD